jgi:hypothetical protein
MLFSAGIAALGLMNDSAAVVIGAMLVAPLMTPIMAFASALIQTWSRRAFESFLIVVAGAFLGVAVGWLTSMIIPRIGPDTPLPEQVLARTSPNLVDLGIALLAGASTTVGPCDLALSVGHPLWNAESDSTLDESANRHDCLGRVGDENGGEAHFCSSIDVCLHVVEKCSLRRFHS